MRGIRVASPSQTPSERRTVMFEWPQQRVKLRTQRAVPKRPAACRLQVEVLEDRTVPASAHFLSAASSVNSAGELLVKFKEAGLGRRGPRRFQPEKRSVGA